MNMEKTPEELKKENAELRAALAQARKAYELLGDALKNISELIGDENAAKADSVSDIKGLLKKYSRL